MRSIIVIGLCVGSVYLLQPFAAQAQTIAQTSVQTDGRGGVWVNNGSTNVRVQNGRTNVQINQNQNSGSNTYSNSSSNSSSYQRSRNLSSASSSSASSYQESSLSLDRYDLRQPIRLEVQSSGRRPQGRIVVNGRTVAYLSQPTTAIYLNRWLGSGTQRIDILGTDSRSARNSLNVRVKVGPDTVISQQTQGNYSFRQTLWVDVDN
ncbi:hypothetical protein [Leptolyngbya sp. FACHB-261]|uniref:hypothetical protein n=1 Tax=Leptolyngbya sp. FACHB-261 TaxID=2692806 RepID=UPI001684C029|nr:hypothetical protein [Leptolyngbya sp. FACHB-261]MBD2102647.1 hypothetical protein [Leptolyngbya sp. FACHB-261]